ncbi:MAG: hypothetical protein V2J42_14110 [Wenzhouxiangella sp.]|nr:hypothetical protein [Wenzhouxiangella sp.]
MIEDLDRHDANWRYVHRGEDSTYWADARDLIDETSLRDRVIEWGCKESPLTFEESVPAWLLAENAGMFVMKVAKSKGEFREYYMAEVWRDVGVWLLQRLLDKEGEE